MVDVFDDEFLVFVCYMVGFEFFVIYVVDVLVVEVLNVVIVYIRVVVIVDDYFVDLVVDVVLFIFVVVWGVVVYVELDFVGWGLMLMFVKIGFCRVGGVVEVYIFVFKRKKIIFVFIIRVEEFFVWGLREIGDVREVDV